MQELKTSSYAVIYVPYYRLQCALLKRAFSRAFQAGSPAENFSLSSETFTWELKFEAQAWTEMHEGPPAALLDANGEYVIELNPSAEAAGIPLHASTSLAVARAPE